MQVLRALLTTALVATAPVVAQRVAPSEAPQDADGPLPAVVLDWGEVSTARLDPSRALPWPASTHPDSVRGLVERFAGARWRDAEGEELATGDVLAQLIARRAVPDELEAALAAVQERWPAAFESFGGLLADLVRDRDVRGDDWLPSRGTAHDGFHVGPELQIGKDPMPSWRDVRGSKTVQQAATFIRADLVALELAENDYRRYRQHVGTTYESIYPVPGSVLRSSADAASPFAALQVAFVCDLPFPFSSYSCELQVLKRLGEGGLLQTDTWSDSRDFFWIAGSNVYVPIEKGDGTFVGMVAVRTFGFDLRGVPDGDSDRLAGLRAVLGNLKRGAEALFAGRDEERELVLRGTIPSVPILGRRG